MADENAPLRTAGNVTPSKPREYQIAQPGVTAPCSMWLRARRRNSDMIVKNGFFVIALSGVCSGDYLPYGEPCDATTCHLPSLFIQVFVKW
jgi:hypothetical protein